MGICFGCGSTVVYPIHASGKKDWACSTCIDVMNMVANQPGATAPGVEFVYGRLKREVDEGMLHLLANEGVRYKFDPEIDGKCTGVACVVSVDPGVIRMERLYDARMSEAETLTTDFPGKKFNKLTENSVVVLREFGAKFPLAIATANELKRNTPGILDAIAFTPSDIRLTEREFDRGQRRLPIRFEIITMKVNYIDLERVMDVPA